MINRLNPDDKRQAEQQSRFSSNKAVFHVVSSQFDVAELKSGTVLIQDALAMTKID